MSSPDERLRSRIRERGPIPFAAFMEEALYGEGGYYARADPVIGPAGDYITGSSLSPLFGRGTARLIERLDGVLRGPAELLEAGFGPGAHLAAVLAALDREPGRRVRAWDRVARPAPAGVERVRALAEIAPGEVRGLIFSYELFDAQPVHRLVGRAGGGLGELWVALDGTDGFRWQAGELSRLELADLLGGQTLQPGQVADLAPGRAPLYEELICCLGRGLLVTCDYGYERDRLLDPRVRPAGTLACYRRHRVHRNPFALVGEQDLTAHVDFTALRETGEAAGLTTVAFTRQARWLTALGIFDGLGQADAATREAARALLDPGGMGEEIRVLVQARGVDSAALFDLALLGP